jgi:SAM-dependent methyltransferase
MMQKSKEAALIRLSPREVGDIAAQITDLPSHDRDEMAIPTYTHKNLLARWVFWQRHRRILQLAELTRSKNVLDFGTGIGALLPSLCAAAGEVHATDLRDHVARLLASRRGLAVQFHDPGSLDSSLGDKSLDLIIAADVLEHIEEPAELLAMFHRKLRPSGAVIASIPTENLVYRIGRFVAGFSGRADYHKINCDAIRNAFSQTGFRMDSRIAVPCPGPFCLFEIARFRMA